MVQIEHTRCVCDHCDKLGPGIIISATFREHQNDSIQLCLEHANWIGSVLTEGQSK
ncbi:hypothetical protein J2736_006739 [Paenibacillus qinlingensis]|uniref:Uncharacterized protein n=1 Tax=Paenibacillus qinlingensis TaxID=1837343 RepID=A0ABU1P6U1_9BACL|nr:hypothetical protein [Paenibacillus qinlingensis]